MRWLRLSVLSAALLVPLPAVAGTIVFDVSDGGELAFKFGLLPAGVSSPVESDSLSGSMLLTSGPLLDLVEFHDVVNDIFYTDYTYGPGQVAFQLTDLDSGVGGTLVAATTGFMISVCEGCDTLFGGSQADDFVIGLGEGLFSPALANALGLSRKTFGGSVDFGLEDIDGDASDNSRTGFDHRGGTQLEVGVSEVPEPSLLLLLTAGAGAICGRRGTSRARTSGRR